MISNAFISYRFFHLCLPLIVYNSDGDSTVPRKDNPNSIGISISVFLYASNEQALMCVSVREPDHVIDR